MDCRVRACEENLPAGSSSRTAQPKRHQLRPYVEAPLKHSGWSCICMRQHCFFFKRSGGIRRGLKSAFSFCCAMTFHIRLRSLNRFGGAPLERAHARTWPVLPQWARPMQLGPRRMLQTSWNASLRGLPGAIFGFFFGGGRRGARLSKRKSLDRAVRKSTRMRFT